jgi:hypothetical protein
MAEGRGLRLDEPGAKGRSIDPGQCGGRTWAQQQTGLLRFLTIANGSLLELATHLFIAHRLDHIAQEARDQLLEQTAEIDRVLEAFMRSLRASLEP